MASSERVFLGSMSSGGYGLRELCAAQLAAPRVRSDASVAPRPAAQASAAQVTR